MVCLVVQALLYSATESLVGVARIPLCRSMSALCERPWYSVILDTRHLRCCKFLYVLLLVSISRNLSYTGNLSYTATPPARVFGERLHELPAFRISLSPNVL